MNLRFVQDLIGKYNFKTEESTYKNEPYDRYWYDFNGDKMFPLVIGFLSDGTIHEIGINANRDSYTNPQIDISLEKPANWDLEYSERNGRIALKAKDKTGEKFSTLVEISGSACVFRGFSNPREELEADIDRIQGFYNLSSVTMLQNISETQTGNQLVTQAVIGIPVKVWNGMQFGVSAFADFQPIMVMAITRKHDTAMAYIYFCF